MPVYVDISTISSSVVTLLEFKSCEKHNLLKAYLSIMRGSRNFLSEGGPSQKTLRFLGKGFLFCCAFS